MFTGRPHQGAGNSTRRWMITESAPKGGEEQNPAYRPARPFRFTKREGSGAGSCARTTSAQPCALSGMSRSRHGAVTVATRYSMASGFSTPTTPPEVLGDRHRRWSALSGIPCERFLRAPCPGECRPSRVGSGSAYRTVVSTGYRAGLSRQFAGRGVPTHLLPNGLPRNCVRNSHLR